MHINKYLYIHTYKHTCTHHTFIYTYTYIPTGLEHRVSYFLRSLFLSVGSTLFCFRLLIDRCYTYWVPLVVRNRLGQGYRLYRYVCICVYVYRCYTYWDPLVVRNRLGQGYRFYRYVYMCMYIYIYICIYRLGQGYRLYRYIFMYLYIYIYICVCISMLYILGPSSG
jgi:hypothetical protein